ncbi:hypothetical protein Tco_0265001 [Tanacetum coccineum]
MRNSHLRSDCFTIRGLTVFVDIEFLPPKPPVSDAIDCTDQLVAFNPSDIEDRHCSGERLKRLNVGPLIQALQSFFFPFRTLNVAAYYAFCPVVFWLREIISGKIVLLVHAYAGLSLLESALTSSGSDTWEYCSECSDSGSDLCIEESAPVSLVFHVICHPVEVKDAEGLLSSSSSSSYNHVFILWYSLGLQLPYPWVVFIRYQSFHDENDQILQITLSVDMMELWARETQLKGVEYSDFQGGLQSREEELTLLSVTRIRLVARKSFHPCAQVWSSKDTCNFPESDPVLVSCMVRVWSSEPMSFLRV